MLEISFISHPNQSFSINLEGNRYELTLKDCDGFMVIDIACNNQKLVTGQRLISGVLLIPYPYLEQGNFLFITDNGEMADWQQFGQSQFLYFVTQQELQELREA